MRMLPTARQRKDEDARVDSAPILNLFCIILLRAETTEKVSLLYLTSRHNPVGSES